MTRRDYELIAEAIRESWKRFKSAREHAAFANDMADALACTNERFDGNRFIMACVPTHIVGGLSERHYERFARERQA